MPMVGPGADRAGGGSEGASAITGALLLGTRFPEVQGSVGTPPPLGEG